MTREEDLKEIEVSIPKNYLDDKEMDKLVWQVMVELFEGGQTGTRLAFDKEPNWHSTG